MKALNIILIALIVPSLLSFTVHKHYVSTTVVEYVKEKESIQIISEINIDDLEKSFRERYDEEFTFAKINEAKDVQTTVENYLQDKISIKVNGQSVVFRFIGKEYDNEYLTCYLEVSNINEINQFEITNKVLFESFKKQQNVVKLKINGTDKSYNLIEQNNKAVLNF